MWARKKAFSTTARTAQPDAAARLLANDLLSTKERTSFDAVLVKKGAFMGNNKNPNQKRPGEKEPGTFHYNPGNMSGKPIGGRKDESDQDNADRKRGRRERQEEERRGS
jgi:hypothetical protein